MKLIVGLGNPGQEYENTRHNSGFLAMDRLSQKCQVQLHEEKFNALLAAVHIANTPVLLMKPLTFMNESGQAVVQAVNYYHIALSDILVLHDDMDLPVGAVRIRKDGSSGGQKGMRSIQTILATQEITRIRIGVGHDRSGNVPDYVLSPVPKQLQDVYCTALQDAADAAYAWVSEPLDRVMNRYNINIHNVVE